MTLDRTKQLGGVPPHTTTDPLVVLLYLLMRDHLHTGIFERLVVEGAKIEQGEAAKLTNPFLAQYAENIAERLRLEDPVVAAEQPTVECRECDGCGWSEGIGGDCDFCEGTGRVCADCEGMRRIYKFQFNTESGKVDKIDQGPCPTCCGDEIFTVQEISTFVKKYEEEAKTDSRITPWAIITWLEGNRKD